MSDQYEDEFVPTPDRTGANGTGATDPGSGDIPRKLIDGVHGPALVLPGGVE